MIKKILRPIKHAFYFFLGKHYPQKLASMKYQKKFGVELNWNDPKDLNEKINWLKFNSDTTQWTRLADKYAVREYVKECGLEDILVPLYGKWDDARDIDFDQLPNSFVLKTNHGYSTNIIVKDKSRLDKEKACKQLNKWASRRYGIAQSEPHYYGIKPCIIAEKLLVEKNNSFSSTLVDYKVWCFNGKPQSIWVCYSRTEESVFVAEYDTDWHYHPECSIFTPYYRDGGDIVPKPDNLDQLLTTAAKLSKGFPQVRIDFYNIDGKIYFGEMTFTCAAGFMDFYTKKCLIDKGDSCIIPKVIIWGVDNSNTLGLLRQLSNQGVLVYVVLFGKVRKWLSPVLNSKYCKHYYIASSLNEGLSYIETHLTDVNTKPTILTTGDLSSEVLDQNRHRLSKFFIIPGTKEQGLLTKVNDKREMLKLASEIGFNVPISINYVGGSKEDVDVPYPCLVKPIKHSLNSKGWFKVKICENKKQLSEVLLNLKKGEHYQIQEYVNKECDLLIYGCRLKDGRVVLPGTMWRERGGNDGDGVYGFIEEGIPEEVNKSLINAFLEKIDYYGLFSVEFGYKKGVAHFFEFNLRNDGTSHLFWQAGVNIPMIWVQDCYDLFIGRPEEIHGRHYFIDEILNLNFVKKGNITKAQHVEEMRSVECYKYIDPKDPSPYKAVNRKRKLVNIYSILRGR